VVCVTGGGGGVGRAIVERFAAAGDRVVALGRAEHALREAAAGAAGSEVSVAVLDVTDEDGVERVFGEIGRVDVLVNNAGIAVGAPLQRVSLSEWEAHLRVNATGAFLCTRAVLPQMRDRGFGRIVMVASTAAHVGAPYTSAYTASKHAVVGLMRAVAAEVAGSGVTANAVCPAYIRTPMTTATIERIVQTTGRTEAEAEAALIEKSPLERFLEPEEVAATIEFLASPETAAINGQTIVLDGGAVQR
jgi:NAD(P)-dependent dehydrogenase (short-subunit alcohol dehydrogenase family)